MGAGVGLKGRSQFGSPTGGRHLMPASGPNHSRKFIFKGEYGEACKDQVSLR